MAGSSRDSQEKHTPAVAPVGVDSQQTNQPALRQTEILEESGMFSSSRRKDGPEGVSKDYDRNLSETIAKPRLRGHISTDAPVHRSAGIGRFILLETLGSGAMGEVYAAYDGHLDRKVAIKLVHSRTARSHTAKKRLLREAQTLAQVSHPNVVQVYEAGEFDGRVFLAMEYIRGVTLGSWLDSIENLPERTRQRDIIRQFIAAGRGLQAAHDAGLAHRDFKPDNVLIGDDGRLRVVDFGLARVVPAARPDGKQTNDIGIRDVEEKGHVAQVDAKSAISACLEDTVDLDAAPDSSSPSALGLEDTGLPNIVAPSAPGLEDTELPIESTPSAPGLEDTELPVESALPAPRTEDILPGRKAAISFTATGTIMGTPRYMAPEQMHGRLADSRSDQFSFCVALFEALLGRFPYPGNTLAELIASVERHALEPIRSREVPAPIRRALQRGLAVEPDHRYADIGELLDTLESWLRQPRRRSLAIMAVISALGVGYGVTQQGQKQHTPVCEGARQEIAQVWNPQRESAIEQVILGTDSPYAKEAWTRVKEGLDSYSTQWAAMHRNACVMHQQGQQSSQFLDTRMACLDRRRHALTRALDVLSETDINTLDRTVDVVQKLPRVDYCADTQALMDEVPPPEEPAVRTLVDDLRSRLDRVQSLESMGRYEDATELATALVDEAKQLPYPPIHAEALLSEGRVRMNQAPRDRALAPLASASYIGFRYKADVIGLEALARQVFIEALQPGNESLPPRAMVEALAERSPDRAFVHALLLNNVGVMYLNRGKRERAREYFERAIAAKANTSVEDDLELVNVHANLARLTHYDAKRVDIFQQATHILEQRLGPSHPRSIDMRANYALYHPSPKQGIEIKRAACERYRFHPSRKDKRAYCVLALSYLFAEIGDISSAQELLARVDTFGLDRTHEFVHLSKGYGFLYAEDHESAMIEFRAINDMARKASSNWWAQLINARANLGRGISEHALGRSHAAVTTLDGAMTVFQKAAQKMANPAYPRLIARTRVAVAETLWSDDQTANISEARTRACSEVDQAIAWYRSAGTDFAWRVQSLAPWNERCSSRPQ